MSVRAVTKLVPDGPGLRFYRDLDFYDADQDQRVENFAGDPYAIPLVEGANVGRAHKRSVASRVSPAAPRNASPDGGGGRSTTSKERTA